MPGQHKVSIKSVDAVGPSTALGLSRTGASHLVCMETTTHPKTTLGSVLTMSELASALGVTLQTLYDLRSQGRGPRGFRVGRELRFRVREGEAWLEPGADPAETSAALADELTAMAGWLGLDGVEVVPRGDLGPMLASVAGGRPTMGVASGAPT